MNSQGTIGGFSGEHKRANFTLDLLQYLIYNLGQKINKIQ